MTTNLFSVHDLPLTPEDLDICRIALERICLAQNLDQESEHALRAAALIIELYRQGVRDVTQLMALVGVVGEP
jgi:hypothetical protein